MKSFTGGNRDEVDMTGKPSYPSFMDEPGEASPKGGVPSFMDNQGVKPPKGGKPSFMD